MALSAQDKRQGLTTTSTLRWRMPAGAESSLLLDSLQKQSSWGSSAKRFLVSFDFGITEPAALELLAKQPNLEVRVPNGSAVLASPTLRPPHTFHAKGYLFRAEPWESPSSLITGSANLSVSALVTGSEVMAQRTWSGQLRGPTGSTSRTPEVDRMV